MTIRGCCAPGGEHTKGPPPRHARHLDGSLCPVWSGCGWAGGGNHLGIDSRDQARPRPGAHTGNAPHMRHCASRPLGGTGGQEALPRQPRRPAGRHPIGPDQSAPWHPWQAVVVGVGGGEATHTHATLSHRAPLGSACCCSSPPGIQHRATHFFCLGPCARLFPPLPTQHNETALQCLSHMPHGLLCFDFISPSSISPPPS